eukprot:TRINITY_DN1687_c0_g1_i10.p1 TRINITY_DN1687_c0_g1~~TRINITY_DN1687_c0_g1_i10.p1  ORF type:complete len:2003 (-),score=588.50 TRINITY_DN1687_c0_g1_i10:18-6026(-)
MSTPPSSTSVAMATASSTSPIPLASGSSETVTMFLNKALQKIAKDCPRKNTKLRDTVKTALDTVATSPVFNNPDYHLDPPLPQGSAGSSYINTEVDHVANLLITPLKLACESRQAKMMSTALDSIQKLMAYGYLRGAAWDEDPPDTHAPLVASASSSVSATTGVTAVSPLSSSASYPNQPSSSASYPNQPSSSSSSAPAPRKLMDKVIETVGACFDFPDDHVQLQIIKAFLTAVTSPVCDIHDTCLMNAVRSCYNIFLVSRNQTNTTTSKATLTQMLNIVFQRMDLLKSAPRPRSPVVTSVPSGPSSVPLSGTAASRPKSPPTDSSRSAEQSVAFSDCFLIFRALCKLSMKDVPDPSQQDSIDMKSKILSLELLLMVLENSGASFRTHDKFISQAVRKYLCVSLLKNAQSPSPRVFKLSLSIFLSLMSFYREHLHVEIGDFFNHIYLPVLGNPQSSIQQRWMVLQVLHQICKSSISLFDLFTQYPRGSQAASIFERMVYELSRVAQENHWHHPQQELKVKVLSLEILVAIMKIMSDWSKESYVAAERANRPWYVHPPSITESPADAKDDPEDAHVAEFFERFDVSRLKGSPLDEALRVVLRELPLPSTPHVFDSFLERFAERYYLANVTAIAPLAPSSDDTIMPKFSDADGVYTASFYIIILSTSIHQGAAPPSSTTSSNGIHFIDVPSTPGTPAPGYFRLSPVSLESWLRLVRPVLMDQQLAAQQGLPTSPTNARARTSGDISESLDKFLTSVYERVAGQPFLLSRHALPGPAAPTQEEQGQEADVVNVLSFPPQHLQHLRPEVDPKKPATPAGSPVVAPPGARLQGQDGQAANPYASFSSTNPVLLVRPMFEQAWCPVLSTFSLLLEDTPDPRAVSLCLEGFTYAIRVACVSRMPVERATFVTSLSKFCQVESVRAMQAKNIESVRTLINVTLADGNYLGDSWEVPVRCISTLARLHLIGQEGPRPDVSGAGPSDATYLDVLKDKFVKGLSANELFARFGGASKGPSPEETNYALFTQTVDPSLIEKIFSSSPRLSGHAIVALVRSLIEVSTEEISQATPPATPAHTPALDSAHHETTHHQHTSHHQHISPSTPPPSAAHAHTAPNTATPPNTLPNASTHFHNSPQQFSLRKLFEVLSMNMGRIDLVWGRIWTYSAPYLARLGVHENQEVAIYAIDLLRQLATKFLDLPEVKNELKFFHIQRNFLRPFEMISSRSPPPVLAIRELVVVCLCQLVRARSKSLRSGWRSVLQVLTNAANDVEASIVKGSFDILTEVIQQLFPGIVEQYFTEVVACVGAFARQKLVKEISQKSIEMMSQAAVLLGAGRVLSYSLTPITPSNSSAVRAEFTTSDQHTRHWMPILTHLSRLGSHVTLAVRTSGMNSFFAVLAQHGPRFSSDLWSSIYRTKVLTLFESVGFVGKAIVVKNQEDSEWIKTTCLLTFRHVIEIFNRFFDVLAPHLPDTLALFTSCLMQENETLAKAASTSLLEFLQVVGPRLDSDMWDLVCRELLTVTKANSPAKEIEFLLGALNGAGPFTPSTPGTPVMARQQSVGQISNLTAALRDSNQSTPTATSIPGVETPPVAIQGAPTASAPVSVPVLSSSPGPSVSASPSRPTVLTPPPVRNTPTSDTTLDAPSSPSVSRSRPSQNNTTLVETAKVIRCKGTIELLMVVTVHDVLYNQAARLATTHVVQLLSCLEEIHTTSKACDAHLAANASRDLAAKLAAIIDQLRKQETQALSSLLKILFGLFGEVTTDSANRRAMAEAKLLPLCISILSDLKGPKYETGPYVGIVVQTLQGILEMEDDQFGKHLPSLFGFLGELAMHDSIDIRHALKDVVMRAGPRLGIAMVMEPAWEPDPSPPMSFSLEDSTAEASVAEEDTTAEVATPPVDTPLAESLPEPPVQAGDTPPPATEETPATLSESDTPTQQDENEDKDDYAKTEMDEDKQTTLATEPHHDGSASESPFVVISPSVQSSLSSSAEMIPQLDDAQQDVDTIDQENEQIL